MRHEHALEQIATQIYPDTAVAAIDPLDPGNRRATSIVRFADADPVVVRRMADPKASRVEARLLSAIDDRTSVPVAAPVGSGTHDGEGWIATPLITGSDLHESFSGLDPTPRRRIAESFGRYLAELHDAFQFDSHGSLAVVDGQLVVDTSVRSPAEVAGGEAATAAASDDTDRGESWGAWLAAFGRASIARLPADFDGIRAELEAAIERVESDTDTTPRLFPWDLRPGNALVEDGQITAVVDWEGPLAAAPALAVAKTEYLVVDWYVSPTAADALRDAFRSGYESVRGYPSVQPVHRLIAVASTAVDSRGDVTNPGYPPVSRGEAVAFHRSALTRLL